MKTLIRISTFLLLHLALQAQVYDDYIGTGNFLDVTTMSSDPNADGMKTINGDGYEVDLQGSSRFLARATMGPTIEEIQYVSEIGMEAWIDEQVAIPGSNYTLPTINIIFELYDKCIVNLGADCDFNTSTIMWRYAYWDHIMKSDDLLRQRVAQSLSEVLVLSDRSMLQNYPHGLANYFDILSRNAFGNYRDVMMEVTLHPMMGFYLSHFNNPLSDPSINRRPDENYAREIMQLFSIGLYELNIDGSRKLDPGTGLWIPTYDNDDIAGLAKVFTGLSGSKWENDEDTSPVLFGRNFARYSKIDPMMVYENFHEQGEKHIVGNFTIPDGQSGMVDIEMAVDHLFNHPNVGPFLALRLIQRMVKSNPSPDYIARVAGVFNDNGNGVRGDLEAMVKAILLDTEALECYWAPELDQGNLRAPMLRYTALMRGLKAEVQSDMFWNSGALYNEWGGQHTLSAPSVFNFYSPDYIPNAEFAYEELVGPEFQILNSNTSSNYVNYWLASLHLDYFHEIGFVSDAQNVNHLNEPYLIPYLRNDERDKYSAELSDPLWLSLFNEPDQMLDYLDILLANGHLSDETKNTISSSIARQSVLNPTGQTPQRVSKYAAFMVMVHPEYVIMK